MTNNTVALAYADEPIKPNREIIEAMKAARRGDLETVESIDNLLDNLNADD